MCFPRKLSFWRLFFIKAQPTRARPNSCTTIPSLLPSLTRFLCHWNIELFSVEGRWYGALSWKGKLWIIEVHWPEDCSAKVPPNLPQMGSKASVPHWPAFSLSSKHLATSWSVYFVDTNVSHIHIGKIRESGSHLPSKWCLYLYGKSFEV